MLLSRRLDELSREYARVRVLASTLHSGSVVPAFRTVDLSGDSLSVGEAADADTRQLLFFFTTTCPYCRATLPIWVQLADSLEHVSHPRIQVIALSLDSMPATSRYVADHHLAFRVATFPSAKVKRLYRAGMVPATIVLDHEGRVLYGRTGLLDRPEVRDSIYLAATLPLRPIRKVPAATPAPVLPR
jgi:peroxiredoxin